MVCELIHLGGEKGVTGSCHLLRAGKVNIMVDCGIFQGERCRVSMNDWPVKPSQLDFLFLTHAHIDHVGRVPELIRGGFRGEIICTHPTRELLFPMLGNAVGLAMGDDVEAVLGVFDELSWGFEYDTLFDLPGGIRFKLGNAGHILGSAFVAFTSLPGGGSVTFSGDLGPGNRPILPDPAFPDPCDLLVMESTYGDRMHGNGDDRVIRLGNILSSALSDRGIVYIPSFSLGRTQELIYEMDRLFSDSSLNAGFPLLSGKERIPVFIDSPLGLEITRIYGRNALFWNGAARELFRRGDHPLDFDYLFGVKTSREHRALLGVKGPAVVVAGSGMCTGGRIVKHLKRGLPDPLNDIFFVGYQGRGTLGRDILRGRSGPDGHVWIEGEKVEIKAAVHNLSGYSAHADQGGLVGWVTGMAEKPGRIKIVHGEKRAREKLQERLVSLGFNACP